MIISSDLRDGPRLEKVELLILGVEHCLRGVVAAEVGGAVHDDALHRHEEASADSLFYDSIRNFSQKFEFEEQW